MNTSKKYKNEFEAANAASELAQNRKKPFYVIKVPRTINPYYRIAEGVGPVRRSDNVDYVTSVHYPHLAPEDDQLRILGEKTRDIIGLRSRKNHQINDRRKEIWWELYSEGMGHNAIQNEMYAVIPYMSKTEIAKFHEHQCRVYGVGLPPETKVRKIEPKRKVFTKKVKKERGKSPLEDWLLSHVYKWEKEKKPFSIPIKMSGLPAQEVCYYLLDAGIPASVISNWEVKVG